MPEPLERIVRAGLAANPQHRPALADFIQALRAGLNQLLADALVPAGTAPEPPAPVALRLTVARQAGRGIYEEVAAARPGATGGLLRDMKRVPRAPSR